LSDFKPATSWSGSKLTSRDRFIGVFDETTALGALAGLRVVEAFVPEGAPLVVGVEETLERRQGKKIRAKGIYRDIRLDPATPTL